MTNLSKTSLWLLALVAAVATTALAVFWNTRPAPPDLGDLNSWILVKKDVRGDREVRVFVVEHVSTTWDSYDVAQNQIVVTSGATERQFRWPHGYDFAAGWCEIIHGPHDSVAVVLFGAENVVRVVGFVDGRFVFRPKSDELLADGPLTYAATKPGELMFEVRRMRDGDGSRRVWRWMPHTGFKELTE